MLRQSTTGLSADFPLANLLGFSSYTIYTSAFLYSSTIRAQYAARHPDTRPSVRVNDFVFALHGSIMIVLVYSQFSKKLWGYQVDPSQKPSRLMLLICATLLCTVVVTIMLATVHELGLGANAWAWTWIDVVSDYGPPYAINRQVSR